jgi:C4-type Zn-finger protein
MLAALSLNIIKPIRGTQLSTLMTSKCPSCKSTIAETGWSMEEIDVDHHRAIRANIMYCNKCQGILTIFQK